MGNANVKAPPTLDQLYAFHWVCVGCSMPSVIATIYMIQHVLRSKQRRRRTLTRILLGMSCMDFLFAACSVFGSAMSPKDAYPWLKYAIGTWGTCEAFGFILHGSSTASILYNGVISFCYLLTIRYSWTDRDLHKIELYLHLGPHIIGWTTAATGLGLDLYNPTAAQCRIQEYPSGCQLNGSCQRGANASLYYVPLFFVWVWGTFVFICVAMVLIYQSIRRVELRSESREFTGAASSNTQLTQQRQKNSLRSRFATQALLYCIAYFITWLFGSINMVVHERLVDDTYIPILFLIVIFEPLQGFMNFLIYFRPRYLAYRRKQNRQASSSNEPSSPPTSREGLLRRSTSSAFWGLSLRHSTPSLRRMHSVQSLGVFQALRLALGVDDDGDDDDLEEQAPSDNTRKINGPGVSAKPPPESSIGDIDAEIDVAVQSVE